jgi:hypothetical protein
MKRLRESAHKNPEAKRLALIQFLKLDPEEVDDLTEGYDEDHFEYGREEYAIFTDEEADVAFKDYQKQLWDDMGLESFTERFKDYIIRNLVDDKQFWKDMKSDIENWIIDSPDSYSSFFDIDKIKEDILKELKSKDVHSSYYKYMSTDYEEYEDKKEFVKALEEEIDLLDDDEVLELVKSSNI